MTNVYDSTILIVDDIADNIDILVELLDGFRIKVATNGEDALQACWEGITPDLILLDIMMSGIDGFQVCEQLRKHPISKEIPVIFITAKSQEEDIIRAFNVGGQDFVTKPFNVNELLARVNTHLQLKKNNEELHRLNRVLEDKVLERT